MDPATITNIFGKIQSSGSNIFHEIAAEGAMVLLNRVSKFVMPSIRYLLREENYSGQHCVHIVAYTQTEQNAIELMEKLVSLGADINAKYRASRDSVLHVAVRNNNHELVKWMCQQPTIDLNAVNDLGWTAYRVAFDRGDEEMMIILKTYGVDTEMSELMESDESD